MTWQPPGSGAAAAGTASVMLASLNLHGGHTGRGVPFDVGAAGAALAADVIALQEAWRPDRDEDPVADMAAALGGQVLHAGLAPGVTLRRLRIAADARPGTWGLALVTMLPVIGYELVSLGRAPGDPVSRGAQLVSLELPGGRPLRIVNAHLTHRFASPVQLIWLTLRLAASSVPTVIAGDLNLPGPLTGLAAGYQQAVTGPTFPAWRPLIQLDHILTGRGVTAAAGTVLPPMGSDHLPVRARLAAG
ncbi:MAG: endonuclease/exonuclease/phosphatase family protein [Actinobacteria bacterium]|nr:endonuclease/exonuclease/phosphatase family protein [Actinomycetota bacterium]